MVTPLPSMSANMTVTRRQLLRGLGTGTLGAIVAPSLDDIITVVSASPTENRSLDRLIRLSRNENPYGASREVIAGLRRAQAHSDADQAREQLRSAIAARHRVPTDHVVLSAGSSAILRTAANAQLQSRGRLVAASPTSEWFARSCHRSRDEIVTVPLTPDYAHDLAAMLAHSGSGRTLVYVCNPNNPTGTLTPQRDLESFVGKLPETTRVLIDEAYHQYVTPSPGYGSFLDSWRTDPRIIVTRSFSKIHGLAGLRIGYAVAVPETARSLRLYALESSVNAVSATAALIALNDDEHVRTSMARNENERQEFFNEANARMVRVIDSQTNFVMINIGRLAAPVVEHFRKHNIVLLRPFVGFENYIRVSLGTLEDMHRFWRVWDLMPRSGSGHGMHG
jgi:histidinol-phosphate aminotransferase